MPVKSSLEVGQFYTNSMGIWYLCEKIEGNKFTMLSFASLPDGTPVSAVFVQDMEHAYQYLPVIDEQQLARLKVRAAKTHAARMQS